MAHPVVIVIGARAARQGIGEYVAAQFARHGACVAGIVGTSAATVDEARAVLQQRHGIACQGHTDVAAALAVQRSDIVAICSPYVHHAEHLEIVGRAGVHCLCEKPFISPFAEIGTAELVRPFVAAGRHLSLVTQWPCTLPTFYELHPDQAGAAVERFAMRLSPMRSGVEMAPDAVPHFLSMLRALLGPVWIGDLSIEFAGDDAPEMRVELQLDHAGGHTSAVLHLATCSQRPRPAWYAINARRVDREIELPAYRQFLRSGDRRVPLEDPLSRLVQEYLCAVAAGQGTDANALAHDQDLLRLVCGAIRGDGPAIQ